MDTALAEALSPVLRDLESSGSVIPEVRDDQWSGVEEATAMLRGPDGSGQIEVSHPLSAVVRDGRAVWTCPAAGDPVSEIGQLGRPQG